MAEALLVKMIWLFLPLILSSHVSAQSFSVVVPNSSVSGLVGGSVTLPCTVSANLDVRKLEVRWYRPTMYSRPALLYKDEKLEPSADVEHQGRVSLIGPLEKGDVSLKLDNLRLTDKGEYICQVGSDSWYDKNSMSLIIQAVGSSPILSVVDAGEGKVNVSCHSHGWLPEPLLNWRNSDGRDLKHLSKEKFITDSTGLFSVNSWLLISPTESEWLSCSLALPAPNGETRESRVVPKCSTLPGEVIGSESWKGAFIVTLILLLLFILGIGVYCLLHKKGLISFKRKETGVIKNPEEAVPLTSSPVDDDQQKQKNPETVYISNPAPSKHVELQESTPDQTNHLPSGVPLNSSPVEEDQQKQKNPETVNISNPATSKPDVELQESTPDPTADLCAGLNKLTLSQTPVSLTIDPNETPHFLSVRNQGKSVSFSYTGEDNENPEEEKIFTLCKEKFSSGKQYWEVKLKEGYIEKLSWFVGVASDTAERMYKTPLAPENGFWVLGYDKVLGVHIIDKVKSIPLNFTERIVKLRVFLDCDNHTLSFYNAETQSLIYTFTNVTPKNSLYPLISPGIKDRLPITIS